MEVKENDLIKENGEKLKEMVKNKCSYEELWNQRKIIDELLVKKMNDNLKSKTNK